MSKMSQLDSDRQQVERLTDVVPPPSFAQSGRAGDDAPYGFAAFEWFAIVSRGSIAFRFGPFDGPSIGKIMTQCQEEKIPVLITANCGTKFSWEIARDFGRGIEIRAGDHVRHEPSGEDWVVAYVDGEYLAACGWPFGEAKLSDCTLTNPRSDEEHIEILKEIAKLDDKRGSRARMRLEMLAVTDD